MDLDPIQRLKAARMALYAATVEDLFTTVRRGNRAPPNIAGVSIGGVVNDGNWTILGQFRADDDLDLVQSLRTAFDLGQDNFFYGLLLVRQSEDPAKDFNIGDMLALIRGTETAKEWLLDACASPESDITRRHPQAGLVPDGFYSIYRSMEFLDQTGRPRGAAAHALADLLARPEERLTIVGHSLGAAEVAYLTYDVADLIGRARADAALESFMIASPHPGDQDFAAGFKRAVPAYTVVNWCRDIVPALPPFPFTDLLGGIAENSRQRVVTITAEDVCGAGHWRPQDTPTCNHHAVSYARMLTPDCPAAIAATDRYGC